MQFVDEIQWALEHPNHIEQSLERLNRACERTAPQTDSRYVQQARCSRRFVTRFKQFQSGVMGDADLLSALRDVTLFVGSFVMPPLVADLVNRRGRDFGLSVSDDRTLSAVVGNPEWFEHDEFLRQVYGMRPSMAFPRKVAAGDGTLTTYTDFTTYRSFEQKIAVRTMLDLPQGYTLCLSLSTGAGKSLVSQLAAAVGPGMTLLVVPTVALGLDQYRAASQVLRKTIRSEQLACYSGGVSTNEMHRIVEAIHDSTLKLLITSPEAIMRNPRISAALRDAADHHYLSTLAIDEAHIVQDWGAFFRTDFQVLAQVRRDLVQRSGGILKTILLSATMTEEAEKNLQQLFSDNHQWVSMRCDALRTEPRYLVERIRDREQHRHRVLQLCRLLPKPLILYEVKPEAAEAWAKDLRRQGFKQVKTFTGDTRNSVREQIVSEWSQDEIEVVVATSAFGLGVDRPDIRSVIHATLPENINRFYQEVGRGGRDGRPSLSVLCVCSSTNGATRSTIIEQKVLTVEYMADRWFSMLRVPSLERSANQVVLDIATPPSHFSPEERKRAGQRNMNWNLNTLLLLQRYGFLTVERVDYDVSHKNYTIRVAMHDTETLQDPTLFIQAMDTVRQSEVKQIREGWLQMELLVKKSHNTCVSNFFVDLFPHAERSCGGCGAHIDAFCFDHALSTFQGVIEDYRPNPIYNVPYGIRKLLVYRNGGEDMDAIALAKRLQTRGYTTIVGSDESMMDTERFSGLTLNVEELEFLIPRHPALLKRGGIVAVYGDHDDDNQRLWHALGTLESWGVPVAVLAPQNLLIKKEHKMISQLMNVSAYTYREFMEVF